MTRDLWAMDHGAARQTAPFWLVIVFWEVCCDMEGLVWQKMAQWGLSAARRSFFEPWIEALSYLKVRFRVQHGISVRKPRPHCRIS